MHRFFVPQVHPSSERLCLRDEEAHHATRVLRLGSGDEVFLLNGQGTEFHGVIESVNRQDVVVCVRDRVHHPLPAAQVTLVQAVAKSQAMDGVVHRAVELGATAIQPLLTARSVSRPDDAEAKREKWQAMAIEAAKQSGNPWLTHIHPLLTPQAWLQSKDCPQLLVIASLADAPESLRTVLSDYLGRTQSEFPSIAVLIGPEGDFSPEEYAAFHLAGARPVSLGPLVLRVETAAIALLAMVQYELRLLAHRS